jgi:hypothetical protein
MATTTVKLLLASLSTSDDVAYVLSAERRLVRTNEGWARFAQTNGGEETLRRWPLGSYIDDAIPTCLRPFYVQAFGRCLASGERWEHEYECSSPQLFRKFRMLTYPMHGQFLVVVNSRIVETPHTRPVLDPDVSAAGSPSCIITMCSHCRRVQSRMRPTTWNWVPVYVSAMPANVSHGLCEPCAEFYAA